VKTVLVPADSLVADSTVVLQAEERQHLRVRRAVHGEAVRVCDGHGVVAEGRLELEGRRAIVVVGPVERVAPPPPLVLAVAGGDRERFGWLVEKCVELGATAIIPLDTERGHHVANRLRPSHIARLANRARETLKQCDRAWAPEIHRVTPLEDFFATPRPGSRFLADRAGSLPADIPLGDPVTVAVGPEGGFTAEELAGFSAAGYRPVCFGTAVLRFETAAMAAAAYVSIERKRGHDE
jgi:16S rRNA (uracil1498-N3)-methyltransferase